MKPFVVTSLQAAKMPRWLLLALCVLYVVPGLLGRDPWRFADAAGFGISWTMAQGAHGATDWLLPNVVGLPMTDIGPGPFWLGALAMKALPFLPADTAMRLTALCWLALLLCSVWYAGWLLAGRTVLLVTHDPLEALRLGNRILVMSGRPVTIQDIQPPSGGVPRPVDAPDLAEAHARLLAALSLAAGEM